MKTSKILLTAVILTSLSATGFAVDNTVGTGNGIAYGTGSVANGTKDVAIGKSARVENYVGQNASIAIGNNAHVENMSGGVEASLSFGQTPYSGDDFSSARIPTDANRAGTGIAIGNNTYARTGSTMVGNHNYIGKIGDVNMNTDTDGTRAQNLNAYSTTIGTNSFSNGALTTNTGTFNIMSSSYTGGRFSTPSQNFGSTITGTLNSIESKTAAGVGSGWFADRSSVGVANTISGVANRTANTNGSLVYGAGNEITNSIVSLGDVSRATTNAAEFAGKLRDVIKDNNGGGATMAIGGGNKADWVLRTSIIGVNNTVTGTNGNEATDNFVAGISNTLTNGTNDIIVGNNRNISGSHSVILGGIDTTTVMNNSDVVAVGHNSNVLVDGGVAIGANSVASTAAGQVGYNSLGNTSSTWKSTVSAVSVGDTANNITRQITSVAAGTQDTDAVNVAQLRNTSESSISQAKSYTDDKVKHVGASAAALSALHPLDYNPDHKTDVMAGVGYYKGRSAVALGVAHRPNENVLLTLGLSLNGKDTMANAGVSYKVGSKDSTYRSPASMAKDIDDLKAMVNKLIEENKELREQVKSK
nr:MAG TPA: YadA-like membrane anchor domain protein [Caudoviricetes sp.]